jgi:arylsulfatase A-like enzyme
MNKIGKGSLLSFGLLAFLVPGTFAGNKTENAARQPQRPNIVFIMADDMGWRDLGCFGSTYYETPNIDRLAKSGVRFTQAYSDNPLCSPTRAAILSGMNPARFGILQACCHVGEPKLQATVSKSAPSFSPLLTVVSANRLDTAYYTIAEALRDVGYHTAHFGKWHVGAGAYEASKQGFELDIPHTPNAAGPGGGYLAPWKFIMDKDGYKGTPGEHIEDWMSGKAADQISKWSKEDRPFYLQYWAFSVHAPISAKSEYTKEFAAKANPANPQHNPVYAAMVKSLDDAVGRILKAIDDAGIRNNTIILFYSDNGGLVQQANSTDPEGYTESLITSNVPLRSGKASIYEGGTRVPCIWSWQGKFKAGTENNAMMVGADIYPTLLELCGVKNGHRLDGISQVPAILNQKVVRDEILCHFPALAFNPYSKVTGYTTHIRKGDFKLIRYWWFEDGKAHKYELYDIKDDISEKINLVATKHEKVKELAKLMDQRLLEYGAVNPIPNPGYNPESKQWLLTGWFPPKGGTSLVCTSSGLELTVSETEGDFEINLFKTNEYKEQLSFEPSGKNFTLLLEIVTTTKGNGFIYPIQEGLKGPALKASREKSQIPFDLSDEKCKITEIQLVSAKPLQGINLSLPRGKYVVKGALLKTAEGETVQQWKFKR